MKRSGSPTFRAALAALALCISVTAPVYATGLISGDLDHDADVDMGDSTILVGCLSGAAQPHNGTLTCQESDIDRDGDVDMSDFGSIQACFTGPGVPGDPYCGGCVLPRKDRSVTASPFQVTAGHPDCLFILLVRRSVLVLVARSWEAAHGLQRRQLDEQLVGQGQRDMQAAVRSGNTAVEPSHPFR